MAKKIGTLALPIPDKNGFFQTPHDVKIGGKVYSTGSWLKLLSTTASNKTWLVRAKYHSDINAVNVRSAIFLHTV
jgi:hypothetical protein